MLPYVKRREVSLGCENENILVVVHAIRGVTFPMHVFNLNLFAVVHTEKKQNQPVIHVI